MDYLGSGAAPLGCRVLVPWQGGVRVGLVVAEAQTVRGHLLKEAIATLDQQPWVSPAACRALIRQADRSATPVGLLLSDLVGSGLAPELDHQVRRVPSSDLRAFGEAAERVTEVWTAASSHPQELLDQLRRQGLLLERASALPPSAWVYAACGCLQGGSAKQRQAAEVLSTAGPFATLQEWSEAAQVGTSVLQRLLAQGVARRIRRPKRLAQEAVPSSGVAPRGGPWEDPSVQRLHGGKARERLGAVAKVLQGALERGQSALVLCPDHASLQRHLAAFGFLGPLHFSGRLDAELREQLWAACREGGPRLAVGSYAALCLPLPELSLIAVEDEGNDSYALKVGSQPFLPDLAATLAEELGARLLLFGDIPASESLLRPGITLPPPRSRLHVVALGQEAATYPVGPLSLPAHRLPRDSWPLSSALLNGLHQVVERQRQAVVLAPRRGYSALIRCSRCGHSPSCPHCQVPLRLHAEQHLLSCAQCGHRQEAPSLCPECGASQWAPHGPGTEWIRQALARQFPDVPIWQRDADHREPLTELASGHSGLLVATQSVLQSEAPPDLALIAISLADSWLGWPDFRASERFHRLLRQAACWHPERAPLLVVQTYSPEHPALRSLAEGEDVAAYLLAEHPSRKALGYPPFGALALIEVSGRSQELALARAQQAAAALLEAGALPAQIRGPSAGIPPRRAGLYRELLLLRAKNPEELAKLLPKLRQLSGPLPRVAINPRRFLAD